MSSLPGPHISIFFIILVTLCVCMWVLHIKSTLPVHMQRHNTNFDIMVLNFFFFFLNARFFFFHFLKSNRFVPTRFLPSGDDMSAISWCPHIFGHLTLQIRKVCMYAHWGMPTGPKAPNVYSKFLALSLFFFFIPLSLWSSFSSSRRRGPPLINSKTSLGRRSD